MSTPTDADNRATQPSGNRRFGAGTVAAAAAVALVVGVGAGLAVGALAGGGGSDPTAQDDLDAMCRYVRNVDTPLEREDDMLTSPVLGRMVAVGGLAVAAGYGDDDDALRELGMDVITGSQRMDTDLMNQGLEGLAPYCG